MGKFILPLRFVAFFAALSLSACGGGGTSSTPASVPTSTPISMGTPAPAAVTVRVTVPLALGGTLAKRRAQFVSPSTRGILVTVFAHGTVTPVVAQVAVDISSTSASCTVTTTTRVCNVPLTVAAGAAYDFTFATYDAPPVSNAFTGANKLGVGSTANVLVVAGQANSVGVSIGGIVASAAITPAITALKGLESNSQTVTVDALDAAGNTIVTAGSETYVAADGSAVQIALGASGTGTTMTFAPTSVSNSQTAVTLAYAATSATGTQLLSGFTASLSATPGNGSTAGHATVTVSAAITTFATTHTPDDAAKGPDGNVWFAEDSSDIVGRVTPAGTVTELTSGITPGAGVSGMVTGADRNLWFAELDGNAIARLAPGTGTVTEFSGGLSAAATPYKVGLGPDGNVWFTELLSSNIGRITPTGVITEFPLVATSATSITGGSDGNIWFTETGGANPGAIGRITPTGTITEFPVTAGSEPYGIALGPDGNIWFTEQRHGLDAIGRITPAGVVTEFRTGVTPNTNPTGITAAPDGNLWFTELHGGLGRITPAGVVTEFALPSSVTMPSFITAGADGNLWFGEDVIGGLLVRVII
jgi:streptogramin lyase